MQQMNAEFQILPDGSKRILLSKDGHLSFNSYFNSWYEKFYVKYTSLNSFYYQLKLEGDFRIDIYREWHNDAKKLIYSQKVLHCKKSNFQKIQLPLHETIDRLGRIYLEISCLSAEGVFAEGFLTTDQKPTRNVSLALIICTFNRETYVKKTLQTILEDEGLRDKSFRLFIIDNARTLKKENFQDDRIKLVSNINAGGSGGFNRGFIEALQENKYTHFVFMDDDIELDAETIFRTFAIYEYARYDIAIAGSILDLYKKCMLHEAGALYTRESPFCVKQLKYMLALDNTENLNALLIEEDFDYGGFWFFAFPKELMLKVGLLLPMFRKMDDIEFGLRIKKDSGHAIVAFPSIAVWHRPFYIETKFPLKAYYDLRNRLITNVLHRDFTFADNTGDLKMIIFFILGFQYYKAAFMMKAWRDYLRGPVFFKTTNPEVLHNALLTMGMDYSDFTTQNSKLYQHLYNKRMIRRLKRLFMLLTLERANGVRLLVKYLYLLIKVRIRWNSAAAAWKKGAAEIVSKEFWENYLELRQQEGKHVIH